MLKLFCKTHCTRMRPHSLYIPVPCSPDDFIAFLSIGLIFSTFSAADISSTMESRVFLTRSARLDENSGQLVFYNVIDSNIVSRSSVLSSIVEAGGEAGLPGSVTLRQLKTWMAAIRADREFLATWSCASVCTAMKVRPWPSKRLSITIPRLVSTIVLHQVSRVNKAHACTPAGDAHRPFRLLKP